MTRFLFIDFDNTLMETESLALPSLIARFNMLYAAQIGRELTLDEFHRHFQGLAREGLCRALSSHFGVDVDCPLFYADRDWFVMEHMRREPVAMAPNVIPVLRDMQARGFTLAVVTNTSIQRALAAMRYAANNKGGELAAFFGTRLFEAGDIQKPDPTVYLRAMTQVDASPEQSYAVEDSPTGMRAAIAAGLKTFGFIGFAAHPEERRDELMGLGAIACFNDWSELPKLLCDKTTAALA